MLRLLATLWTVAHQASLTMGFVRQEYRSGLPVPSPEDCRDPGIKSTSPALAGGFFTSELPGKPCKGLASILSVRLCDPMGCSPRGSFSHGILQAEILEWIAISRNEIKFQKKSKRCPLPDFTGSLRQRLFLASQLSLRFWTCQLVTSLSPWDLLSVSILG